MSSSARGPSQHREPSPVRELCNTRLEKKNLRRDGSMLCPVCGQIYWKTAVEKAMGVENYQEHKERIERAYREETLRSVEYIRRVRTA